MKFETKAIHVGEEPDLNGTGDVVVPIHLSTTFARKDPEKPTKGYEYTRTSNPTREALEKKLAALENGKVAYAFSSGLAAETTILLSILRKDQRIIALDDLYGGTKRIFDKVVQKFGISYDSVDLADTETLSSLSLNGAKAIWIETPSNPLMKVVDIREVSKIAKANDALTIVDSTFASPYFQNPLDLGADIVVHSTTKYINGHSDSLGGAVIVRDKQIGEKIRFNQNSVGAVLSPFDSFLTLRGLKTLAVRMKQHESSAMKIATFLSESKFVEEVYYPGLKSNRYHLLANRQMRGFGGMMSFRLRKTTSAKKFVSRLKYFSLAESLGGVESLIELPYYMTHASIPEDQRKKLGIDRNLVRMSIGLENTDDLLEDVNEALGTVKL